MDHTQIPNDWREWWTERSAILQYDGDLPRDAAEQEALVCLRAYVAEYRERQRGKAVQGSEGRHASLE